MAEVPSVPVTMLADAPQGEASAAVRARVLAARARQHSRYDETATRTNAGLRGAMVGRHCQPGAEGRRLLHLAADRLKLTARGYDRVLKVSRTIADLCGSAAVEADHIGEALQFRLLE